MTEDSPKIVSIETSLDLSEFPSEAEPPTGVVAQAPVPPPAAVPASASPDASGGVEPTPFVFASQLVVADATAQYWPDEDLAADDLPVEPVQPSAHARPSTVTDFPVRPYTPAAVALPTLPAGTATLVDLIERRGGLDWREAVAVIHQICLYLKEHSPHAPILLDPRTIQITERGEVHLLSGQTSSDPLVIQVGRLLRTMLMGKEAPPELRLLLSQATFELPIFESIEDVDRALAQLNKLDEPGPAGLALLRAVAAPPPPPTPAEDFGHRPPAIRSILPMQRNAARRSRGRTSGLGSLFGSYSSQVAVIFAAIAVIGILLLTRPAMLFPGDALATAEPLPVATATVTVPDPESATSAPTTGTGTPSSSSGSGSWSAEPERRTASGVTRAGGPSVARGPVPSPVEAPVPSPVEAPVPSPVEAPVPSTAGESATRPTPPPVRRPPGRDNVGVVTITPLEGRPTDGGPTATAGTDRRPAVTAVSARESQRRATELLRQGEAEAASRAFDALVMSNPLYEPRSSDLNPEALAAFRTSQRLILPVKANRNFELATAALAAGDPDRALAYATEARAIIDRRPADAPPQLREQLNAVIAQANEAIAATNEIVYTEADRDVIPPRQLTRQMPVTGPIGVPPNRVGWLDMIIGRDGTVEHVKLNTPLNRHHERMIVSPAKAWKYRPATKAGKPVRYRISVKVNLPESGTDF